MENTVGIDIENQATYYIPVCTVTAVIEGI